MNRARNELLKDPELRLEPMRTEDVESVIALELRCYPFPWTEGIFRDCLSVGYSCWVFRFHRQVVGYGVMSVAAGEAHILNICIDPGCQSKGLGRRMLDRLLSLARKHGADTAFLEVRSSNHAAKNLYLSVGFNEVGLRPGYYPAERGREDAFVLALSL